MGVKKVKIVVIVIICLVLINPINSHAATVDELYSIYNIDYEVKYPDSVIDTIKKYNHAKRYISMYRYVASSEYDYVELDNTIKDLESQLETLKLKLNNGFHLSLDEIYLIEDEYSRVLDLLEKYKKSKISVDLKQESVTADNTPTYDEYVNAIQIKSIISTRADIGNISNLKYPITTASLVDNISDKEITLLAPKGSSVTSLFNGEIIDITDDSITVYHYNDVYTLYKGIDVSYVEKGDTVYQGQSLGSINNSITLKLKLGSQIVNISKLFKEG